MTTNRLAPGQNIHRDERILRGAEGGLENPGQQQHGRLPQVRHIEKSESHLEYSLSAFYMKSGC